MIDDAALLRAYAGNRSEPAFAEFVGRRIGFVYAAALRQVAGDAQTAEDVTQAVFVLAAKNAATLARHERIAGWLHTTTRNTANHAWRDARRRDAREQEAARMSELQRDDAAGVADVADAIGAAAIGEGEVEMLRPMLDEALGALREGEREAVLLRFFEGRGFGEIGARLKMSDDAARKRVSRALEKMRGSLARKGVTSSAAVLSALMTAEAAQGAPAGLAASVSAGAVTAAAAGTGAAAGVSALLAFMSSAKITGVAVITLLIAGGGLFYSWQRNRVATESLVRARQENKMLLAQVRATQRKSDDAAEKPQVAAHDPAEAGKRLLDEHPEIKEKFDAYCAAWGSATAYKTAQGLGLSAAQRTLYAEMWAGLASRAYNVSDYGMVTMKGSQQASEQAAAALGEEVISKLRGNGTITPHGMVNTVGMAASLANNLTRALWATDTPMTPGQTSAIQGISAATWEQLRAEPDAEVRDAFLESVVRPILSEPQMRVFMGDMDDNTQWARQEALDRKEWAARASQSK